MGTPFTKKSFMGVLLVVVFGISGCGGGEERSSTPQGSEPTTLPIGDKFTEKAPVQQAGELRVVLRPEMPGAGDKVEALLVGADGRVGWRWERNGETVEEVNGPLLEKGLLSRGDRLAAIATVRGQEVRAEVAIVNTPPRVESVIFNPGRILRGVDVTATPRGVDVDGDEIRFSYRWSINGEEVVGNDSPVLEGEKLKRGNSIVVAVTASDGEEEGETYTTRHASVQNAPPAFVSTPPLSFEGQTYTYKAAAKDPDGDSLAYSLLSAPKGMVIDSVSGSIQWPITPESSGSHVIEIAVKDEEGLQATQKFSLTMTVPAPSGQQQPVSEK